MRNLLYVQSLMKYPGAATERALAGLSEMIPEANRSARPDIRGECEVHDNENQSGPESDAARETN
jgi:hypothetical protein